MKPDGRMSHDNGCVKLIRTGLERVRDFNIIFWEEIEPDALRNIVSWSQTGQLGVMELLDDARSGFDKVGPRGLRRGDAVTKTSSSACSAPRRAQPVP